jgi:pSer/pThr/pTyr-binding forkhead associated (FHA) protein
MSYYEVLGISPDADDQAILEAYRHKAQESLMDTEAYDLVQEAYETLSSPDKRAEYDTGLANLQAEATVASIPGRPGTAPLRRVVTPSDSLPPDATRALQPVVCANCSHTNPATETYCAECGFLLSSVPGTADLMSSAGAPPTGPRLENSAGHVYPLKPGLNRVGRENADILILDKTVSRYHALVVYDEERHLFSVEDAGSSNGTRVNDAPLPARASHQLNDGDEISFGTTKFKLDTGDPITPGDKTRVMSSDSSQRIEITMPPDEGPATGRLTLQRGKGPQEVMLSPGTVSIGRLPDNQICLNGDRYASGHHAQIVIEESIFRLIDVGSTNGSFLNGLRLTTNESIAMSDGDEIMIGSTVFQFNKLDKGGKAQESKTLADYVSDDVHPAAAQEPPPIESL